MKPFMAAILSLGIFLGLFATNSQADSFVPDGEYKPTSQWWAAELKFGPYRPDVHREFSGTNPYQDIFGSGLGLMSQLTVDVQFFKKHGSLGVGGTAGFFRIDGYALNEQGTPSKDKTHFQMVPLILQLVYRWDYAAKEWGIPLVPYVRGGLVYSLWWITKGNGNLAYFSPGKKAWGGTFGYQVNVGLAFLLDILEPQSAKKMDMDIGVNHSYLFVEFVHSSVDDFGSDKSMQVGMRYSLLAGLTFEF